MPHVAVAAMGADRPGIVAAVTEVLVDAGCNLEDTSMTILRGHFAMMLVVDCPAEVTPARLEAEIAAATSAFDLVVSVRPIGEEVPAGIEGSAWVVVVYGGDRPGIVHRVASELAALDVDIVDLTTRVTEGDGSPVYAMVLEVTVPDGVEPSELQRRLEAAAADLGVECTLHPSEADIL